MPITARERKERLEAFIADLKKKHPKSLSIMAEFGQEIENERMRLATIPQARPGRPLAGRRRVVINVGVDADMLDIMDSMAHAKGVTRGTIIDQAVKLFKNSAAPPVQSGKPKKK